MKPQCCHPHHIVLEIIQSIINIWKHHLKSEAAVPGMCWSLLIFTVSVTTEIMIITIAMPINTTTVSTCSYDKQFPCLSPVTKV